MRAYRTYTGTTIPITPPNNFTPASISGLLMWLDALDAATITKDGNNKVSSWLDKSGNGNHATQTTSTNQPFYDSAALKNLPSIFFNGTSSYMTFAASSSLGTLPAPFTIIIVASTNSVAASTFYRAFSYNTSNSFGFGFGHVAAQELFTTYSVKDYVSISNYWSVGVPVVAGMFYNSTTKVNYFMNAVANENITGGGYTNGSSGGFIGCKLGSNLSEIWNGPIGTVLLYNRQLSTAEWQYLSYFLINLWKI